MVRYLPYAVTYFYNVYGPRERAGIDTYGTVVATFAERYLARKPLEVRSPGTQTRAFTHVADTIDGIVLVGEKGEGDGYGLSAHDMYSLLDLAHLFGNDIVMLPQTQTTRETSVVDSSKIEVLELETEAPAQRVRSGR